jgi:hypothetical protein
LNDLSQESMAFVQFWLSHELSTSRLRFNLSVPSIVEIHTKIQPEN